MVNKSKGSISVFMVFILFIMLAATGTLLEGSRYYAVKTFSKTALTQASDAVKTEYYSPLSDEYHLFFLASVGEEEEQKQQVQEHITSYLNYALESSNGISDWKWKSSKLNRNLAAPCLENIEVSNIIHGTDAGVFEKETAAYMKYQSLDSIFEKYLKKFEFAKTIGKTTEVLNEKVKTEQEVAKVSSDILEMMKYIDGVTAGKYGVEMKKNGRIQTESHFAKQFVPGNITQQSTGINQNKVWISLKNKYINVDGILFSIHKDIQNVQQMKKSMEETQSHYTSILESEDISAEEKKQLTSELSETIEMTQKSIEDSIRSIANRISKITDSVDGVESSVEKAIGKFPEFKKKQKEAVDAVRQYRQVLNEKKTELEQSTYSGLDEDCKSLEKYISNQDEAASCVNSILSMKPVLEKNLQILENLKQLKLITVSSSDMLLTKLDQMVMSCQTSLENYDIQSLRFDYSDIATTEEAKNPLKTLKEAAGQSVLKLVVPNIKELSKNKIVQGDQLANQYLGEKKEGLSSLLDFVQNLEGEEGGKGLFEELLDNGIKEFDWSSLSSTANVFLVNEYINQQFHNYTSEERKENLALNYELEYILTGHNNDRKNLETVVNRLVLWRTVLNFVSILSDREKGEQAGAAATALAGITGMEPLIQAAKTLILIVWSFDEALVDVAALLRNQSVVALKSGKQFQMKFSDLFCITADTIEKKAKQIKKEKDFSLFYEDYLNLFLLIGEKQRIYYRAMDLIQENIRRAYNKSFDIQKTIYAYEVSGIFQANYRFLFFSSGIFKEKKNRSFWKTRVSAYGSYA